MGDNTHFLFQNYTFPYFGNFHTPLYQNFPPIWIPPMVQYPPISLTGSSQNRNQENVNPQKKFPFQSQIKKGIQRSDKVLNSEEKKGKKLTKKKRLNDSQEYLPKGLQRAQIQSKEPIYPQNFKLDRNIESNAFKLFLKTIKSEFNSQGSLIKTIILKNFLDYTENKFMDALCRKFPETMTYIRPFLIKKACLDEDDEDQNFRFVLRVAIMHFYKQRIHMLHIKSIRTSRRVRYEQIKAGRRLMMSISKKQIEMNY